MFFFFGGEFPHLIHFLGDLAKRVRVVFQNDPNSKSDLGRDRNLSGSGFSVGPPPNAGVRIGFPLSEAQPTPCSNWSPPCPKPQPARPMERVFFQQTQPPSRVDSRPKSTESTRRRPSRPSRMSGMKCSRPKPSELKPSQSPAGSLQRRRHSVTQGWPFLPGCRNDPPAKS